MISNLTLVLIFILLTLIFFLIVHFKKRYEYWQKLAVPYVGISGDIIFETRKTKAEALQDRYNELAPEPFGGFFQAAVPFLIVRDPELIRTVLIKDFSHFTDRATVVYEEIDPLTSHIFLLKGQRWKNIRTKLAPTFTSGKLRAMFPLMEQCTDVLNGYLEDQLDSSAEIEVQQLMMQFAIDVIGTCAFGFNCNAISGSESEFRTMARKMSPGFLKFRLRHVLNSISPKIVPWLGWKGMNQEVEDFFMEVTREAIRHREENENKRTDFMQLLINLQHEERKSLQKDTELVFSDYIVAAQVFVFFVAGFETISTTLATCLYELALNPEVAKKIHDEIERVLEARGGKLDYDALKQMRYMECVIEETLRKYPPLGFLERTCTKAYELPNSHVLIKEGTRVAIPVYALHHDPQYFPKPEKFDPDRFNDENRSRIVPGTYLPFGDGPRICIGMRFALMEARAALTLIMRNYTVHATPRTQIPLIFDKKPLLLARPEGGVFLRFQKREN